MRSILLLVTFVGLAGCTSTTAVNQADPAYRTPRTRTLPSFSQRMRYQQLHKEPPAIGKTTVEGKLVR